MFDVLTKRPKTRRSLDEILQSTSDVLFPDQLGEARISVHSRGCDGDTPLHVLLWRGDDYGATQLIDAGADIDAIGDMGTTPLYIAMLKEDLNLARLLVESGARSDIVSEFGTSSRDLASELGGEFGQLFR